MVPLCRQGNPKDDLGKMRMNLKGSKSARSESTGDYSSSTDQWSEIGPCRTDRIPMQSESDYTALLHASLQQRPILP